MKHGLLVLAVLSFLAPVGCVDPSKDPGTPCALVLRILAPAEARDLAPGIDMAPTAYRVSAMGPQGRTADAATEGSGVTLEGLEAGVWDVAASGLNAAGTVIGWGGVSVTLAAGERRELSITVAPLAGQGTLDLTVLWTPSAVPSPSIRCLLVPAVGVSLEPAFQLSEGRGVCLKDDVPAGWYTLELSLENAGAAVAGAAEAVRIVQGQTTSGSFDFSGSAAASAALTVGVVPRPDAPLAVVMLGGQNEMGRAGTCRLKALVDGAAGTVRWYLDGAPAAEGSTFLMGPGLSPGLRRVDAVAVSEDLYRAGSSGRLVRVLESLPPGSVSWSHRVRDGVGSAEGLSGCRAISLSPDGKSLYAAGTAVDSLVWMDRDTDTGTLFFRGRYRNGSDGVSGLAGVECAAVSPDGRFVYAGGASDGAIAVFRRDGSGALSFVSIVCEGLSGVDGLAGVRGIALSPDGLSLYAAGFTDNALAWFLRDAESGGLSFRGRLKDGEGGVDLLGGVTSVAVSPDGSAVFAAAWSDDALLAFSRDPATGDLNPTCSFLDGVSGVDGLNGVSCVTVSPEGTAVFAASYYDNALTVFLRDPATGALSFSCVLKDGVGGVDGLHYARGCAASPDGRNVYGTGAGEDALAAFARDPATGAVSFLSVRRNGADGVEGLDGARGCAVSTDGGNVYVAGTGENGVVAFNRIR